MGWGVAGALAGLALVDSTSFGTLILPLVMLLAPRVKAARVLTYLATIAGFYWLLGLALLLGAQPLQERWEAIDGFRITDWVQLVIGVLLFALSFWPDTPWAKRQAKQPGRRGWMREALVGEHTPVRRVMWIALLAGLIEAASMLPYLGAVGLISTSGLSWPEQMVVLVGYVVVMCLPALVLLGIRLAVADRVEPLLTRLDAWLSRKTSGAIWWVIGIIGVLLAIDAWGRLQRG